MGWPDLSTDDEEERNRRVDEALASLGPQVDAGLAPALADTHRDPAIALLEDQTRHTPSRRVRGAQAMNPTGENLSERERAAQDLLEASFGGGQAAQPARTPMHLSLDDVGGPIRGNTSPQAATNAAVMDLPENAALRSTTTPGAGDQTQPSPPRPAAPVGVPADASIAAAPGDSPVPSHHQLGVSPAVRGPDDEDPYGLAAPEQNADLRHTSASLLAKPTQGPDSNQSRLDDARRTDRLMQALGGIIAGTGGLFAGPRGLPDRAALERQVGQLGGREEDVSADIARERTAKDASTQAQAQLAQRGAQDRTRQEQVQREDQRLRQEQTFRHGEGELDRASRERIAAGGQTGQATRAAAGEAANTERERMREEARARLQEAALAARHHGGSAAHVQAATEEAIQAAVRSGGLTEQEARDALAVGGRHGLAADFAHARGARQTSEARAEQQREAVDVRQRQWREQHGVDAQGRVPIMPNAGVYSTNIALAQGPEGMKAREGISDARTIFDALGTIQRVAQSGNPADPHLEAQLAGARSTLLASMGQAQHFGVLSDNEKQRILDAIPNPESARQWVLGTGAEFMRSHVSAADSRLRSQLATAGVDDAGIANALHFVHTGAQGTGGGGFVRLRNPQGETRRVPADRADAAVAAGWTRL